MSAVEDVRALLARFGPQDVQSLWAHLERRYGLSEVRAALRKVGATARVYRDWPRYASDGRLAAHHKDGLSPREIGPKFTLWSLPRTDRMFG